MQYDIVQYCYSEILSIIIHNQELQKMNGSLMLMFIFLFRLAIAESHWQEVPYFCLGHIRHISF